MTTRVLIATRTLSAIDPHGREFDVTLGVGQPYEISPNEWACPVCLDGLHDGLPDMHGGDSWQALQLAWQLIAQLLGYFVADGGRLCWHDSHEPRELSELIPHIPDMKP